MVPLAIYMVHTFETALLTIYLVHCLFRSSTPVCKTCKKFFSSDYSLKRHVSNIHDKEKSEEDESDEETGEFMTTEDEVETIGTIIKDAMVVIANEKASDEDEEEEVNNTSNTSDETISNSVEDITEDEDKYVEIFNQFKEIVSQ